MSHVSLEPHSGPRRPYSWGRKDEEYIADFCLIARRELTEEEYRLFRYHFLLAADWRLCTRRLSMSRGNFFHAVYRIEQKLGRIFRELEPYGLFPLDDYFGGAGKRDAITMAQRPARRVLPKHLEFPRPHGQAA